jgi:hypothetical protein
MADDLAPIGLSTYSRLWHLQQAITALQKNTLARQSELFVFSDAPKPGDEDKVEAVRRYLSTIDGFKAVHILERETNDRVANCRGGIEELLNKYGKLIFLEDDVVTAPGFLQFMNDALEFYKNDQRIGSISGYCPPIELPRGYSKDIFALTIFSPWGFGLWKRYYRMNTPIDKYELHKLHHDKKRLNAFDHSLASGILLVTTEADKKFNAGDVRSMFWQFIDNKMTIFPRKSLTQNIGADGSGVHTGISTHWNVQELWNQATGFKFHQDICIDEKISDIYFKFNRIRGILRLIVWLDRLGLYKYIRPILRKLRYWGQ